MELQFFNRDNGTVTTVNNIMLTRFGANDLGESGIVYKINRNEDGFFDFSKNFVDIGAYIGVYTCLNNFAQSYAFEGNQQLIHYIYANTLLYDKGNANITQALLSDKSECVYYDGYNCELGNSPDFNKNHSIEYTTKTLDAFNIDNVGLIKIDVEGMEERVIRGGIGTIIRSNYPPILFECWNVGYFGMTQEKHDSLFNFLKSLGYEILEQWGDFQTHLAVHK